MGSRKQVHIWDICAGNSRDTQGVHSFWWEEPPRYKRKDVGQIVQVNEAYNNLERLVDAIGWDSTLLDNLGGTNSLSNTIPKLHQGMVNSKLHMRKLMLSDIQLRVCVLLSMNKTQQEFKPPVQRTNCCNWPHVLYIDWGGVFCMDDLTC